MISDPFVKGDNISLEINANTDITGWKIRCEIFDNCGQSVQLATLNSGGADAQIEVTDATNGVFIIKTTKGQTSNFANDGFIEIERETATGEVLTILPKTGISFIDEKINWESPS